MDKDVIATLSYQPSLLLDDNLNHPKRFVKDFFLNYPLHKVRDLLWELYKGWVHLESESPDEEEITDMLFFYEQLKTFIEVSYIMKEKHSKKKVK
jgi:hypothetical protein